MFDARPSFGQCKNTVGEWLHFDEKETCPLRDRGPWAHTLCFCMVHRLPDEPAAYIPSNAYLLGGSRRDNQGGNHISAYRKPEPYYHPMVT